MTDPMDEIGGTESYQEQQRAILKKWGADELLENSLSKKVDEQDMKQEMFEQGRTGSRELLTGDNIDLKSDLNGKEIVAASRLLFMSERYEMPAFKHFVTNILRLKVSNMRKGRTEYIEGLHAEEKKEAGKDWSPIQALMSKIKE